jgi:cell division protein FtsB
MPVEAMFVAITGIVATFFVIRMGMRHTERRLELTQGAGDVGRLERIIAENAAETARLRERVQVLERLVTDDDRKLADEINRLGRSSDGARG